MTQYFNRTAERAKRRQLRREMTPAEVRLWGCLRNQQLLGCRFRRQYSIGPFILDFYCPRLKFGIELDGESHYEPGAPEYDARRQRYLQGFGVTVHRFLNAEVMENLEGVLEVIRREVQARMDAAPPQQIATPPTPPS